MSIGMIRGLGTLVIFIAFVGMLLWVFNGKRKKDFEQAAMLPLVDDDAELSAKPAEEQQAKSQGKPAGEHP
ncbi:cytochrome oxidase [Ventosimonas gracilis]|uniref:Cytochrome oxidase n=1 Tax=Ventosimonas gracilis TaxID=1680762 RepID=A0A139SUU9_9GAMM|nr:CcoQ/FixQ family Cbb3-type cytochrome c oxidase assembly chaperone [Ventosimonas gracilis]KXU38284.1 cytochrome oxidase [Ventosimonas gracilis]